MGLIDSVEETRRFQSSKVISWGTYSRTPTPSGCLKHLTVLSLGHTKLFFYPYIPVVVFAVQQDGRAGESACHYADDLGAKPRSHVVEGESFGVSSDLYTCVMALAPIPTSIINK